MLNESTVESAALDWLKDLGWQTAYCPYLAPVEPSAERSDRAQVLLKGRLRDAPQPRLLSGEVRIGRGAARSEESN